MTTTDLSLPATPRLFRDLTAFAVALTLVTALWGLLDPRLIEGVPVWQKPFKFSLSFVVLFATLHWLDLRLSPFVRDTRLYRGTGVAMGVAMLSEMGWILWQAAHGRASHFNYDTPFEALMYGTVMLIGALALVAGIGAIGWQAGRDDGARLGPATRTGVVQGFLISAGVTLVVALTMSATGRHVGVHPEGGAVVPLFDWSGVVGDLRPAHFLSLHAMQVLPLLGLALDWLKAPGRWVSLAAMAYVALTLAVFVQALMGQPLLRLG